jgi:hypothetical protein
LKRLLLAAIVAALGAAPAQAHPEDLIRAGERVGPIRLYETTVREAKEWFGEPDAKRVIRRGCVRAVRLRWTGTFKMFAQRYRGRNEPIAEVHVLARTVTSTTFGTLKFHTLRDLRIGDSEKKLMREYPGARGETHAGHTHYVIEDRESRVLAKVVDGSVVALEAHPYEWC